MVNPRGAAAGPSGFNSASTPTAAAAAAVTDTSTGVATVATAPATSTTQSDVPAKKKRHRAGKRRRNNRRQSFAASSVVTDSTETNPHPVPSSIAEAHANEARRSAGPMAYQTQRSHHLQESRQMNSSNAQQAVRPQFYPLGMRASQSSESLESEALLDHREQQQSARNRRPSLYSSSAARAQLARSSPGSAKRGHFPLSPSQQRSSAVVDSYSDEEAEENDSTGLDDRTPLLSRSPRNVHRPVSKRNTGYGGMASRQTSTPRYSSRPRKTSDATSDSQSRLGLRQMSTLSFDHDVNNPPSQPGSPLLSSIQDDDEDLPTFQGSPVATRGLQDAIINIDHDAEILGADNNAKDVYDMTRRRHTVQEGMEDVCLPFDQMTDIVDEDTTSKQGDAHHQKRRRHKRQWPDLNTLEEWCRSEGEELKWEDGVRAKKVNEPVVIDGRMRPRKGDWRREEDDAPFRWTYFNEDLDSSLKSHTLSGLQQLGLSFRELFIPDRPILEYDSASSEEDTAPTLIKSPSRTATPVNGQARGLARQSSIIDSQRSTTLMDRSSGDQTPNKDREDINEPPKLYGPRPVFWLDILQPTYEEMRVISRAFGIHKLTAEDIMEQEAREKVELFRNYYFVNYRTFEQDRNSEDYLDPVNMYFVVFKGGVISFHFSQMPHPPNVRRRVRQLAEHQYTDSDWISYAIIDNITDAYAPLIEQIEKEVDDIDDEILQLNSRKKAEEAAKAAANAGALSNGRPRSAKVMLQEKLLEDNGKNKEDMPSSSEAGRDMLLRVGECRKRVMGLYRLLGQKADVIKGLAKRCNEQWQVAPRSDVGLYLGDIQDHIVTMTGNLTHYENILSRAHSNYLAQISLGMNERAEQTADVLGKLTVLGTIVLPMNIITGMWGMNCLVPGQDGNDLWWFFGITGFLILFGLSSFLLAKKVYRIV